jgi:subtilisin family serine protease
MNSSKKLNACLVLLILVVFSLLVSAQDSSLRNKQESIAPVPSAEKLDIRAELELNGRKINLNRGLEPKHLAMGGLFLVQLDQEISARLESTLKASGAEIHDYLGANTYWVKAKQGSSFWNNSAIRAVVRPKAEEKISPLLSRVMSHRDATASIKVITLLVPGTSAGDIQSLVTDTSAERLSDSVSNGRLFLSVPATALKSLAASDHVLSLELLPLGKTLHNNKSANQIGVQKARKKYNLSGDGVKVGIVDGGEVDTSHKEFSGRLTSMTNKDISDHSTHVAGSVGSAGKNKGSKGMAYDAQLYSYDYFGNVPVVIKQGKVQKGIDVFNNSWGYKCGWHWDGNYLIGWGYVWSWYGNDLFGKYTSESRAYDANIKAKNINVVFSAGNDRTDGPGVDFYYWDALKQKLISGWINSVDGPWRTIGPTGVAKNVLTVGATSGKSVMSDFSSWGPTDDGRLKPEITAPGVGIFSTLPGGKYGKLSGTSMAAPITTGSLALIIEHWRKQFNEDPNPEVIRALVAATAVDLGTQGPDYKYGFGRLDMATACKFIDSNDEKQLIDQAGIKKGKRITYDLTVGGSNYKEMRVVVAWLDPAGPTLVNDLDVVVISPSGKSYKAWNPNPNNPGSKAKQTGNSRDNIELVTVKNPEASDQWQIQIDASIKKGSKQRYCLIIYLK